MPAPPKPFWQSKTFWAAALQTLAGFLGVIAGQDWIANNPLWAAIIVAAIGTVNIWLRFVTTAPITFTAKSATAASAMAVALVASSVAVTRQADAADAGILIVSRGGCYVLSQGSDGLPVLTRSDRQYSQVIVLDNAPAPPTPGPTPVPIPTPPSPLSGYASAIRDAARAVKDDPLAASHAQTCAEVYRQIAGLVAGGQIKDEATLRLAITAATGPAGLGTADWMKVLDIRNSAYAQLTAGGAAISKYADLLIDTAAGLDAAFPQKKGIDPELIKLIIQLILAIINKQ